MRRIWLAAFILPILLFLTPAIRAGVKPADTPTVVVRVKSLNALLQNVNLVVKLIGQEGAANQIEGLIKSKIGKQGLEGIDPSRPFGAYVRFGDKIDEINGAILIPIIDEKAFLTLLDNYNLEYAKDKDGIYTHKTNRGIDVYFRFAHKYLCITGVNTESILDKNLPDPAKALALSGDAAISFVARVDQIPAAAKLIALAQLEESIQTAQKNGLPNETKVQEAFRVALLDDLNKLGNRLIREAGEVRFDLDISEKTQELTVNFSVTGKPDSDLAKAIKDVGSFKSPLVGLAKNDLAFQGAVHLTVPEGLQKALGNVIDEVSAKSIAGIQDAAKKKQADALFQAMMPTAKAGEYQLVAAVVGPNADHFAFVGAVKLKDGAKLGVTVHGLLKEALQDIPEDQRGKFQLDFDKVGTSAIHKFEIPKDAKLDKLINEIAGDRQLYLAFRDDALFLALGKDSLPALKTALAKTDSAASQPLVFDFDTARMAKLMAQTPEQKELAGKLFQDGKGGHVRFSIEGGASLRARLEMRLNALEFLVKLKDQKGQ